ncbi:MAG: flagellar export chaperone FliS [Eubacteriales bacterium]
MTQYQKYQKQAVTALTSGEQLILLFEKACVNISKAVGCIETNDVSGAHNAIVAAEDIFNYLIETLDMEYPISHSLFSLYNFINDRLTQANIKKDKEILLEIKPLAVKLKETWREAERLSRGR